MIGQQAAPASRIYHGETVLVVVWSNAAVNMNSSWRVVYDDGTSETLILDRFTTGSSRAGQLISTSQVAKHDGYVTEGFVFSDAAQRGQTYVVVYISQGYNPGDVRAPIAKGYVYASVPLALGQQVEPGPAGGHGAIARANLAATALGVAAGLILASTPTGAVWRWIGGFMLYTASATVGTRSVQFRWENASAQQFFRSGSIPLTAGQVGSATTGPNETSDTTVTLGGTASVEFPAPDRHMPGSYALRVVDIANIDVADTCSLEAQVEEWVMPN